MHRRNNGLVFALLTAGLVGCGGADLMSGSSRPGGLDSGLGGNYGGYGNQYGGGYNGGGGGGLGGIRQAAGVRGRGVYAKLEAAFELPDVKGNPFDYTENDVVVSLTTPDNHTVKIPAFYDGGKTWRFRYTPDVTGRHMIASVSLNGKPVQPEKLEKREFDVSGSALPGFIRRDTRDKTRFAFENGNSYFPIGHNQAYETTKSGELTARIEKMGKAGENWSRIWMSHWDGKALDWPDKKSAVAGLDLEAAKRWDGIVDAAEKAGVHFQMVLQYHGQFSTRVDSNWDDNPLNKKNGGALSTPDEFFSNPRAVSATKAKYRYIIARWGYSPSIMAWELFNEVEHTDAVAHKHLDEVVAWHNAMAQFLRQQDPYKHLITTSADLETAALWQNMDFYQAHVYATDPGIAAAQPDRKKLDKPYFVGELGPSGVSEKEQGDWLRRAVWAGAMSGSSGVGQFWSWAVVDKNDLYGRFQAASDFVRQSGLHSKRGLLPAAVSIDSKARAPLTFSPGAGWVSTKMTEFNITPAGSVDGLASMPRYLQGSKHREMFPAAIFKVAYPEAGTFTVHVSQVAADGAKLTVSVDGSVAGEKDFAATGKNADVDATVTAKVAAGPHVIKVENIGADWCSISRFTLTPVAPALQVIGQSGKDYAALWIANRAASGDVAGKVSISGLNQGSYKATWWDTTAGKALNEETLTVAGSTPLSLTVAPLKGDVAVYLTKSNEKTAAKEKPAKKEPVRKVGS